MTPRADLLKTISEKGFDPDSHVAGEAWIDDSLERFFVNLRSLESMIHAVILRRITVVTAKHPFFHRVVVRCP